MSLQLALCERLGLTGNKWVWCAQEFMQRKCRRRFHKAPNENDAETTDIDNLAALFAQYAESAPIPTRRGTARRSGGRRSKNAVQFDCPEDSDEARANWTIGTVPMCERWFVSTISALS